MKPIIGVMPLWDDEKDSLWMLPGYMEGIRQAGGTPIIFPFSNDEEELTQLIDTCDGILFTGGHDVTPELYHEKPMEGLISCCEKRDSMEMIVLKISMKTNKSILGICRGIQFINAALGGSLYQDIQTQHPSSVEHHQQPPYEKPIHQVRVTKDSPLWNCLQIDTLQVNSYHHQGVKEVAAQLWVMATAPEGLVEALYMPTHKFLWAVQWHPEFSYKTDINSSKIFQSFIDSMQ